MGFMKLKAKIKWSKEDVLVKPVFFCWYVGLQYYTLTGYGSNSLFCNTKSHYIFPIETKIILLFVRFAYWCRMWLWMQVRHWQPNRIRKAFRKHHPTDELY